MGQSRQIPVSRNENGGWNIMICVTIHPFERIISGMWAVGVSFRRPQHKFFTAFATPPTP